MNNEPNYESKAAIARHPLHPIFVVFPAAFLIGAVPTDLAYLYTTDDFWARASYWLIAAGLATGVLAGLIGMIDYYGIPGVQDMRSAQLHAYGNVIALILALVNLGLRWNVATAYLVPWGLATSVLVVAILSVTAWLGGELSYKYHVGMVVDPDGRQQEPPSVEEAATTEAGSEAAGSEVATLAERVHNAKQRYRRAS